MRAQSDTWFAEYLLRIGKGTEEACENDFVQLPDDVIVDDSQDDLLTC